MIHIYSVYGLLIKSDIILPVLHAICDVDNTHIDSSIKYGIVPKVIDNAIYKNEFIQAAKFEFYFYIKGVAHFYIANGNSIVVEPEAQCDEEEVKSYLLGTSLGIMLVQRNNIAIHGGAVLVEGQGIIITGQSGAGKSTLISAFIKSGCPFLADDVSVLGNSIDGKPVINPTYPQQKLCRDAMEKMGYDADRYLIVDSSRDKYAIPIKDNFMNSSVPLSYIIEICIGNCNKVEIVEVLGSEKIKTLLRNIYRIEILIQIGVDRIYFKRCLEIAKCIKMYRITRPRDSFTVNEQIQIIKNRIKVMDENVV